MRRICLTPLLCCLLALCAACGGQSPQDTLTAYGQAIADNDPEAAYALLSPKARDELSLDAFRAQWPALRTQLMPSVGALLSAHEHPARVTATLQTDDDTLLLHFQPDGWKLAQGPLEPYEQTTPRRALNSFLKALRERRAEVLWKFIPNQYTQLMTLDDLRDDLKERDSELTSLVETLQRHRTNPIRVTKNRAFMRYGDRQVVFVFEDNLWKIEDPDG